jgi:RNA polymerase sigma-70 factor (ECF subfamily)
MTNEVDEGDLLRRAAEGDGEALTDLFTRYRRRLRNMVRLRLNRRLHGRVDASDIVQEAYLEAARVLKDYLDDPKIPFFLWLRHLTGQKLIQTHRRHLGARLRDAGREVSLYYGALPGASSAALAAQLLGRLTSPSQAAMRAEMKIRLQEILNDMDPLDREVLVLRHFEQLSNAETAQVLEIDTSAASKRYVRALERLEGILNASGGLGSDA